MLLIDFLLMAIQVAILHEVVTSPVWRANRKTIECVKAMYCSVGLSAVLTLAAVPAAAWAGVLDDVPVLLKVLVLTLFILYSFICHQSVRIYNRRRLRKRFARHADRLTGNTAKAA